MIVFILVVMLPNGYLVIMSVQPCHYCQTGINQ